MAKAKETAEQSAILLKNDRQVLPLSEKIHTIAVVGPMADAPYDQLGTWCFDGEKAHTQTPLKALQQMYGGKVRILYEPGVAYSRDKRTTGIARAVSANPVGRSSFLGRHQPARCTARAYFGVGCNRQTAGHHFHRRTPTDHRQTS